MLFDLANLTYWIFLATGILLFLIVIISGADGEGLDSDADVDVDVDIDTDIDSPLDFTVKVDNDFDINQDTATEQQDIGSGFLSFLAWFGIGKTPLLILLAIDFCTWGVTGWFLTVIIGTITETNPTGFLEIFIFFASLFFSLWVGKILSNPIGQIFQEAGEETKGDRLIGCYGNVTSKQVPYIIEGRIAQADVLDSNSNLVTIEICLPEWANVIPVRGEEILVIEQRPNYFLAIAKDSSDQDKWINLINN